MGTFPRVTHPSAAAPEGAARLACVRPAASVRSEPGSNSQLRDVQSVKTHIESTKSAPSASQQTALPSKVPHEPTCLNRWPESHPARTKPPTLPFLKKTTMSKSKPEPKPQNRSNRKHRPRPDLHQARQADHSGGTKKRRNRTRRRRVDGWGIDPALQPVNRKNAPRQKNVVGPAACSSAARGGLTWLIPYLKTTSSGDLGPSRDRRPSAHDIEPQGTGALVFTPPALLPTRSAPTDEPSTADRQGRR